MEAIKRVYASTFSQHAKALCASHALPPGRREDGGDHSAGGGRQARHALLSRLFRSGALAQFLSRAAGDGATTESPRWRWGWAVRWSAAGNASSSVRAIRGIWCSFPRCETCWRTRRPSSGRSISTTGSRAMTIRGHLREAVFGLDAAEEDGTLQMLGSTYSADNHAVYDGLAPAGRRIVSFAPILKHGLFPLAAILDQLMTHGRSRAGPSGGDRICGALAARAGARRPNSASCRCGRWCCRAKATTCAWKRSMPDRLVCQSSQVLGNGRIG